MWGPEQGARPWPGSHGRRGPRAGAERGERGWPGQDETQSQMPPGSQEVRRRARGCSDRCFPHRRAIRSKKVIGSPAARIRKIAGLLFPLAKEQNPYYDVQGPHDPSKQDYLFAVRKAFPGASDCGSSHDLAVRGFEPHVGLCPDSSEPGACFGFCVSLSLCPSPARTLSLSLNK